MRHCFAQVQKSASAVVTVKDVAEELLVFGNRALRGRHEGRPDEGMLAGGAWGNTAQGVFEFLNEIDKGRFVGSRQSSF